MLVIGRGRAYLHMSRVLHRRRDNERLGQLDEELSIAALRPWEVRWGVAGATKAGERAGRCFKVGGLRRSLLQAGVQLVEVALCAGRIDRSAS